MKILLSFIITKQYKLQNMTSIWKLWGSLRLNHRTSLHIFFFSLTQLFIALGFIRLSNMGSHNYKTIQRTGLECVPTFCGHLASKKKEEKKVRSVCPFKFTNEIKSCFPFMEEQWKGAEKMGVLT